jgi:hypothetical protein
MVRIYTWCEPALQQILISGEKSEPKTWGLPLNLLK